MFNTESDTIDWFIFPRGLIANLFSQGEEIQFERLFIHGNQIRYVHVSDET